MYRTIYVIHSATLWEPKEVIETHFREFGFVMFRIIELRLIKEKWTVQITVFHWEIDAFSLCYFYLLKYIFLTTIYRFLRLSESYLNLFFLTRKMAIKHTSFLYKISQDTKKINVLWFLFSFSNKIYLKKSSSNKFSTSKSNCDSNLIQHFKFINCHICISFLYKILFYNKNFFILNFSFKCELLETNH